MPEIKKVKVKEYTGTVESLENLVSSLDWNFGEYFIDVKTREVINTRRGIKYRPGDVYYEPVLDKESPCAQK